MSMAVQVLARSLVFSLLCLTAVLAYDDLPGVDPDIVGDIFDTVGISGDLCRPEPNLDVCSGNGLCKFGRCECNSPWSGKFCSVCEDCAVEPRVNCGAIRACVEGVGFGQYWKHYPTAYAASEDCKVYNFNRPKPVSGCVCKLDYSPVCGLDGQTYGNDCEAKCSGIAIQCQGECPCDTDSVCEFHDNLDGDSICPAYKVSADGDTLNIYRPPCLADDLEVNVGLWHGEQAEKDAEIFPHGWGELAYSDKDHLNRREYSGQMEWGMREGHGMLYWNDGSYYSGQWRGDVKTGEGTMFYANGDIYTGHWEGEKKAGRGKYLYNKGANGYYEGEFVAGKKCGSGRTEVTQPDQQQWEYFLGEYSNTGARKVGTYNISSGSVYSGEFDSEKGEYQGRGSYVWACGKTYTGQFQGGQPEGEGTLQYPQGWSYTGGFKNGKFHGHGKFTWSPTNFYEGTFKNGEMTGLGVYWTSCGGQFDSATGLFYPVREDKSIFWEAHFDGKKLRVKKKQPKLVKAGY